MFSTIDRLAPIYVNGLVQQALEEDIGSGDVTAELIDATQLGQAAIVTRENMVLCGQAFAEAVFTQLSDDIVIDWHYRDGDEIAANTCLCELRGNSRALLSGERNALNFLQMLSATATQTHCYVQRLQGTKAKLLETRKTIPLFRQAQKYAVYCGGGHNHRAGLYDAFLIKENHIMSCASLVAAIKRARSLYPEKIIDVEVENFRELSLALQTSADLIMLDNFSIADMQTAVRQVAGRKPLEASGTITLENIAEVANTGVDYISIGSLTKNVQAIDLSMNFINGT